MPYEFNDFPSITDNPYMARVINNRRTKPSTESHVIPQSEQNPKIIAQVAHAAMQTESIPQASKIRTGQLPQSNKEVQARIQQVNKQIQTDPKMIGQKTQNLFEKYSYQDLLKILGKIALIPTELAGRASDIADQEFILQFNPDSIYFCYTRYLGELHSSEKARDSLLKSSEICLQLINTIIAKEQSLSFFQSKKIDADTLSIISKVFNQEAKIAENLYSKKNELTKGLLSKCPAFALSKDKKIEFDKYRQAANNYYLAAQKLAVFAMTQSQQTSSKALELNSIEPFDLLDPDQSQSEPTKINTSAQTDFTDQQPVESNSRQLKESIQHNHEGQSQRTISSLGSRVSSLGAGISSGVSYLGSGISSWLSRKPTAKQPSDNEQVPQ